MQRIASVALAISSVFVFFACSSSDDTTASPDTDASHAATADSGTDTRRTDASTGSIADASLLADASLPPLPPAFAACGSCMETTCEPQIAACDADAYCTEILECSITSGCLASGDGSSCASTCASSLGLTKVQLAQETKLLTDMATACTSCLAECPKPDAGN